GKIRVDFPETLANSLDQRAHISAKPLIAEAGDEILAVDEVVNLPIADILAGARREELDDAELGQAQIDHDALPEGAMAVAAQFESAMAKHRRGGRIGGAQWPQPLGDQLQALQQDRQTPRFIDEVDRAAFERGLFINIVRQRGQENDWNPDAGAAQPAQH